MLALKAEHMAMFIAKERIEIQTLWDEIHMGEEERSNCQIFYSGGFLVLPRIRMS
jgi:hypothetical protein